MMKAVIIGAFSFLMMMATSLYANGAQYPIQHHIDEAKYKTMTEFYQSLKKKWNFSYKHEFIDSLSCGVTVLAMPIYPIRVHLDYNKYKGDTTAAMVKAIFKFINAGSKLFNVKSNDLILETAFSKGKYYQFLFKQARYGKYAYESNSPAQIELILNTEGDVMLIYSTLSAIQVIDDSYALLDAKKVSARMKGKELKVADEAGKEQTITILSTAEIEFVEKKVYAKRSLQEKVTGAAEMYKSSKLISEEVYVVYEYIYKGKPNGKSNSKTDNKSDNNKSLNVSIFADAVTGKIIGTKRASSLGMFK